MKFSKLSFAIWFAATAAFAFGGASVDVDDGKTLAAMDGNGGKKLLRSAGGGTNSDVAEEATNGLKHRVKSLSDRTKELIQAKEKLGGSLELSEEEVQELAQDLSSIQTSMNTNRLAIVDASLDQKTQMISEVLASFEVIGQLASLFETATFSTEDITHPVSPWLKDMQVAIKAAESRTDSFLHMLVSLPGAGGKDQAGASAPALVQSSRRLQHDEGDLPWTWEELTTKNFTMADLEDKNMTVEDFNEFLSHTFDSMTNGTTLELQEMTAKKRPDKHWSGFKDGQAHREFKKKHTDANPRFKHVFDVAEHINTGNFEALHQKLIGLSNQVHEKHFGSGGSERGRRRLFTEQEKLQQCQVLTGCAQGMSLYDLIFYYFNDHIDTTTGAFSDKFVVPPGFSLTAAKGDIDAAITSIGNANNPTAKSNACDDLLYHLHKLKQIERDSKNYWSYESGVVAEVCVASGTLEKIDLYLIKKHFGAAAAESIFKDTINSAKALYNIRDTSVTPWATEWFAYDYHQNGALLVRYPESINGIPIDSATGKPVKPLAIGAFYHMVNTQFSSYDAISFKGAATCPPEYTQDPGDPIPATNGNTYLSCSKPCQVTFGHIGSFSIAQCPNSEISTATSQCTSHASGSQFVGHLYSSTLQCLVLHDPGMELLTDSMINSTRRAFGETSLGKIAALAKTGIETHKFSDKLCPTEIGFHTAILDNDGLTCTGQASQKCDYSCMWQQCAAMGGTYSHSQQQWWYNCHFGKCPAGWNLGSWMHEGRLNCDSGWIGGCDFHCMVQRCKDVGGTYANLDLMTSPFRCYIDNYSIKHPPKQSGWCCLDGAEASGVWGEPFQCSQTCTNLAPSNAQLSKEVCDVYGGTYCAQNRDCGPLTRCYTKFKNEAEAQGSSSYNPSFAAFLADAPSVTDETNAEQCGQLREYFGYEPTFEKDTLICKDIGELRFSDMNFINQILQSMNSPGSTMKISNGNESPGAFSVSETVLDNYQITTATKRDMVAAKDPTSACNEQAQTEWSNAMFAMEQVTTTFTIIHDALSDFICPDDGFGATWTVCSFAMNMALHIALVALSTAQVVMSVADYTQSQFCASLDPYSLGQVFEEVNANYQNSAMVYDVLAERQSQTHLSLNSINAQLPKIGTTLDTIQSQHLAMNNTLTAVLNGCSTSGAARRLVLDNNDNGKDAAAVTTGDLKAMEENMATNMAEENAKLKEQIAEMEQSMRRTAQEQEKRLEKMSEEQEKMAKELDRRMGQLLRLLTPAESTQEE